MCGHGSAYLVFQKVLKLRIDGTKSGKKEFGKKGIVKLNGE